MNTVEQQIQQVIELLAGMYRALASLRADVLPVNPDLYTVLAEGPLEEIRRLLIDLDDIAGVSITEVIKMTRPQVIEGTPEEIQEHLKGLSGNMRLTLIVPAEGEQEETLKNLHHATPEERARALDEIAEMNRDLPALPDEAFRRENLYEERL